MEPARIEPWETAELLSRLVDKSLLTFDESTGRYDMLQTVRQYLADHLFRDPMGSGVRDRHLQHFLRFACNTETKVRGPDQIEWLRRYDLEHDNLRAALEWAAGDGRRWASAVDLATELIDYWMVRSTFGEARARLEAMLEQDPGDQPDRRAMAGTMLSVFMGFQGDPQALDLGWAALEEARRADGRGVRLALFNVGVLLMWSGHSEEAIPLLLESLELHRQAGDRHTEAFTLMNLGNVVQALGNLDEAQAWYEQCLAVRDSLGDLRGCGAAYGGLGQVAELRGDLERAAELYLRSLDLAARVGDLYGLAGLMGCACVAPWLEERDEDAARLLGFGDALQERLGSRRDVVDQKANDRWSERLRDRLGIGAFEGAYREGRQLTLDDALRLARRHAAPHEPSSA